MSAKNPSERAKKPSTGGDSSRITVKELMARLAESESPVNETTTYLPPVDVADSFHDASPDLSAEATSRRVLDESRNQLLPATPKHHVDEKVLADEKLIIAERTHNKTPHLKQTFYAAATVFGRVVVAISCVLALTGTGWVWWYRNDKNSNFNNVDALSALNLKNIRDRQAQLGNQTYLIVGTDSRAGKNSKVGAGDAVDTEGSRSDTIILVTVPANQERVVAVSFPRDLQVSRPECNRWDNDKGEYTDEIIPAQEDSKINAAYALGGPKCLVNILTQLSGLEINHFIAMDFAGFEQIVDKIGGVTLCSPRPLYDYQLGYIISKTGPRELNAKQALNYVRARHVRSEINGDYGRIKRQQLFMSSLLRSMLSSNVISSPKKINGLIDTFIRNSFVDNISTESLLQLSESMQGLDSGRVTFVTVPTAGTSTDGQNNEIPRIEDIAALFDAIIQDSPLPGEKAVSTPRTQSTQKTSTATTNAPNSSTTPAAKKINGNTLSASSITARVLNGTQTSGLAAGVSETLRSYGVDVPGVADASEKSSSTVIRYGPGEITAALTIAQLFPGANIQQDNSVKLGVEIIIGDDYSGTVSNFPETGTTATATQLPGRTSDAALPNDLSVTNAADATC